MIFKYLKRYNFIFKNYNILIFIVELIYELI